MKVAINLTPNSVKLLKILNGSNYNSVISSSRLVGGCVRDYLLNKIPEDVDIATSLIPNLVIELLRNNDVKYRSNWIRFGTVIAIIEDEVFEITTLREDIKCLGRHAEVKFTTDFSLDASRRDFTINAMSYDSTKQVLYDYFNGFSDLIARKVIFIGEAEKRIKEDYLRILRFFRFSAYYANNLDQRGLVACTNHAHNLKKLAKERIISEMNKLLNATKAFDVLNEMHNNGIIPYIFNGLKLNLENYKTLSAKLAFYNIFPNLPVIYASLFIDNSLENLETKLRSVRLTSDNIQKIVSLIKFLQTSRTSDKIDYITKLYLTNHHLLLKDYVDLSIGLEHITYDEGIALANRLTSKKLKLPINGEELINLGINTSKIKLALSYLTDSWIRSNFTLTKAQLVTLLKNEFEL